MISYEEALEIVLNTSISFENEKVPLFKSLGRILAEDVFSDINMPPFNKSAMDGFAIKSDEIDRQLEIVETIKAGSAPLKGITSGKCSRIMTGAPIPLGSDMVIMVEHSKVEDNKLTVTEKKDGRNVCYLGEDFKVGDKILSSGTFITPAEMAALATIGCDPVSVKRQPVIGIIATGSELIEPIKKPKNAQIRNSNSYQLYGQILQTGCRAEYFGIVEDDEENISKLIQTNLDKVDILLLTGGVSMGEFDFVPDVLQKAGFEVHFSKVAVKPGKPTLFCSKGNKFVFGLPGNPVSTFMIFELLVKPFCYKLMDANHSPVIIKCLMKDDFNRKQDKRTMYLPVHINRDRTVDQISFHGSADINALSRANGFISIPIGVKSIKKGTEVDVTFIKSSL